MWCLLLAYCLSWCLISLQVILVALVPFYLPNSVVNGRWNILLIWVINENIIVERFILCLQFLVCAIYSLLFDLLPARWISQISALPWWWACAGFNKQPVLIHGLSLECWVAWNKEAWSLTWSIENCLFRHQSFAISVYLKLEIPPVSSFVWMKVKEIVVSMFSCLKTNWFGVVFTHQEIDFICYNEIS